MNKLVEILGWYGTIAIVGAYALMSFSIVAPNGWFYQTLNLTGALGIIAISWKKEHINPQPSMLSGQSLPRPPCSNYFSLPIKSFFEYGG